MQLDCNTGQGIWCFCKAGGRVVIGPHRGEASYGEHCSKQNTDYLIAYEEWQNSLSRKDRVLLGRAAAPDLEDCRAHSSKRMVIGALGDAAARSSASYSPDMAAAIDTDTDRLSEIAGLTAQQALVIGIFLKKKIDEEAARRESRAITAIAGAFLKGTNSKLLAAGLAYASDLSVTSGMGTMQDWARENGVSRAAVSKVAKFWQRELELPAGSHMRDEQKCRAYSEAQRTNMSPPVQKGTETEQKWKSASGTKITLDPLFGGGSEEAGA